MKSFKQFIENPNEVLNEGIADYTEDEKISIRSWLEFALRGIEPLCKRNGVGTHGQWFPLTINRDYNGGVRYEIEVKGFGSRIGEWGLTPVAKKAIEEAFKLGKSRIKGVEMSYDTAEKDWVAFYATLSDDLIKKKLKVQKAEQAKTIPGVEKLVVEELLKKYPDMKWEQDRFVQYSYDTGIIIKSAGKWNRETKMTQTGIKARAKFEEDMKKAIVKVRDSSRLNPAGLTFVLVPMNGNDSLAFKATYKPKS